ncbi:MAG: PIN domain-containing protein [Anaerolineae bacterium]|nr:PIN domain-containing protein [Anaerolineae bacterium]
MIRTVFWDSAAFVALINQRDTFNQQAKMLAFELGKQQAKLITTDAVLSETISGLSSVIWRATVTEMINRLQQSAKTNVVEIVHIDPTLWHRGWQLWKQRLDKDWSLIDCISFIVMQDYGVTEAFTSDHHFEQAGFTRLMKK